MEERREEAAGREGRKETTGDEGLEETLEVAQRREETVEGDKVIATSKWTASNNPNKYSGPLVGVKVDSINNNLYGYHYVLCVEDFSWD